MDGINGIISINKEPGMTSHDVVSRVRKLFHQKRVGHAGTLDPLASGVLPICAGQGTRVAEYLSEEGKAYRAEIIFGEVTDTYDAEGTVIRTGDTSMLSLAQIAEVLPEFSGPQMQMPPLYSAIKIQGQPAYKRARAGETVTMEPRAIQIYRLEVLQWQAPRLTLAIECSKGTYIRSLAYDLGERLGCGAYLAALLRTRSGPFLLSQSITLAQLAGAIEQGDATRYIFPPDSVLQQYPALRLPATIIERVQHGNAFAEQADMAQPSHNLARIYDEDEHFVAIASWNSEERQWHPKKVFEW
jgi:tRNA pseudouridine55 synthase